MFGESISNDPRIPSPWYGRLSGSVSSASASASTTAPATPPSYNHCASPSSASKSDLPPLDLHTIDQYSTIDIRHDDDTHSDISEEADGFFSLDMGVSIDQQISDLPYDHRRPSHGSSTCRRPSNHSVSPLSGVGRDRIAATRANTVHTSTSLSPSFGPIAPEVDQKGNLEYKLKILPPSRERFDRLATQLKWRLLEGGGLAVYEIGVLDDGTLIGLDSDSMKDSLKLLSLMAAEVGATCEVQRVLSLEQTPHQGELNLRALDATEAKPLLMPHNAEASSNVSGLYQFNIVSQHLVPVTVEPEPTLCEQLVGFSLSNKDLSVQAKRTQEKVVPTASRSGGKLQRDVVAGKDQAAIVLLPSKEEKRIMRAAAEAGLDAAQDVPDQHEQRNTRVNMDKMVWVADSVQPKTARAKARARKTHPCHLDTHGDDAPTLSGSASSSSSSESLLSASSVRFSADEAAGTSIPPPNLGVSSGYENVMADFGVLSERAARLISRDTDQAPLPAFELNKGRLIVEAVVRRDASSSDNFIDYQGVSSSFKLNA